MEPESLTRKIPSPGQQRVLDFIVEHTEKLGFSPTNREICRALGFSSTNSVHEHLIALERKGFIKRQAGLARTLTVVRRA